MGKSPSNLLPFFPKQLPQIQQQTVQNSPTQNPLKIALEMVLRRYTPPTCTLEISAKSSPLSRWTGKPVLKNLRFKLHFDDPRLLKEEHITLQGDHAQFEALHDAVTTYVQDLLNQSQEQLNLSFASLNGYAASDNLAPAMEMPMPVHPLPFNAAEANGEKRVLSPEFPADYPNELEKSLPAADNAAVTMPDITEAAALERRGTPIPLHSVFKEICLKPGELLTHDLILGPLATAETGTVIPLSVLQLFDLATALDDCAAEVMALPNLMSSETRAKIPAWARSAALIVVTVGVTVGTMKVLDYTQQKNAEQTASLQSPNGAAEQNLALKQAPSTLPTPGSLPQPLPLPSVGASLPPNGKLPTVNVPSTPVVMPSPLQPPPPLFPPPNAAAPSAGSIAPPPAPPANSSSSQNTLTIIPQESETQVATAPPVSRPQPQGDAESRIPMPPPPPSIESGTPFGVKTLPPNATTGQAALPPVALPPLRDEMPASRAAETEAEDAAVNTNTSTLFDVIPQVAEVREYFQNKWVPPQDLKQVLQYTLVLAADGSIERITPLGKTSGDYIDRTNMPLVGEPFVSAVKDAKNPRIRVVLNPDGKVQTFLEP